MSLAMNSPGARPGRSSHSGTHPASGASRLGGEEVSGSMVEADRDVVADWIREDVATFELKNPNAVGAATIKERAANEYLIVAINIL